MSNTCAGRPLILTGTVNLSFVGADSMSPGSPIELASG